MKQINISSLNESQKKAVIDTEGTCLVIAGPGSGKTCVLTYRVAYLIQSKKTLPDRIMVLTFTKKAAEEMKNRIENILDNGVDYFWIGTFHSVFAKILREEASAIGYDRNFSIYDNNDSLSLIKKIVKELKLNPKEYVPKKILRRIGEAKQFFMSAENYSTHALWKKDDEQRKLKDLHKVYTHYEAKCRSTNVIDFNDILFLTYQLFRDRKDILCKYQQKFDYLLIDEFQDTDPLQYHIIKSLTAKHKNLCVVGDDAQSIYAFRGAEVKHMLSFLDTFPHAKEYKLQQNYRSTQQILNAANTLIKNNLNQVNKTLFTTNEIGPPVQITCSNDSRSEAYHVVERIIKQVEQHRNNLTYNDFAILYRANKQSRILEEVLIQKDIPYQIIGNISFYQRKEIKDTLAYLQLIINTENEEALLRAINQPKRNIGPATLNKISQYAREKGCTRWQAITDIKDWMSGQIANNIAQFAQLINTQRSLLTTKNAYIIAANIINTSGLKNLFSTSLPNGQTPGYKYLEELLSILDKFVTTHGDKATLSLFLQEISLMTYHELDNAPTQPAIKLMTAHRSKGLEFAYVHVIGMEEEIFPTFHSLNIDTKIEEERRLFFVAVTRAKQGLFISYSKQRYKNQELTPTSPSRFLTELNIHGPHNNNNTAAPTPPPAITYNPGLTLKELKAFQLDQHVCHPSFGEGVIRKLEGSGLAKKAIVEFPEVGTKIFVLKYSKLILK